MMTNLGILFSINIALLISPTYHSLPASTAEREAEIGKVDFIEVNKVSNIVKEDSVYAGIINY